MTLRMRRGAVGGLLGALGMIAWLTLSFAVTGRGFWDPLGYIGHILLTNPNVDAAGQVLLGTLVTLAAGAVFGAGIGFALPFGSVVSGVVWGVVYGLAIWGLLQYGIIRLADDTAFFGLEPWLFAAGHALFGAATGAWVSRPYDEDVAAPSYRRVA